MEIRTIGAGAFGQAFAKQALRSGHKVKLSNHRGPTACERLFINLVPQRRPFSTEEAAACQMALLAVPTDNVLETLASLPKWNNQVLIDGTNPFHGNAVSVKESHRTGRRKNALSWQ